MSAGWAGGFGIVGHGVSTPRRHEHVTRRDLCGAFGHPAVTFHPYMAANLARGGSSSWCLCGLAVSDGNAVEWPKPTDCGGYLVDCVVAS